MKIRLFIFVSVCCCCLVATESLYAKKQTRNDFTGRRQYIANLFSDLKMTTTEKSGDYTLTSTDSFMLGDATSGGITFTLPAIADNVGRVYHIKKKDITGNTVTVDGNGSETIDDGLTAVLTMQYESISIANDGTEWWIF